MPDPGRDLLFLDTGGKRITAGDALQLDRVETLAPEAPNLVAECVKELNDETRRMLAEML